MPQTQILDRFVTEYLFKTDNRALSNLDRRIDGLKTKLNQTAAAATAIGTALTAVATGALKLFSDEQAKISEVSAKTGKTVDELTDTYKTAVREISEETGISSTEIWDGFQKAISAGVEGEEAIGLVGQAARAEASGIGALTDQISSATTVTTLFGIEGEDALDKIAKAAQVGEGDTEDFANALKGVSQAAAPMGIEFDELAAALANVSQTSKSVRVGETQLRAFLLSIVNPSESARESLEELTGGLLTFENVQETIKTDGLDKALETLQTITGMDASAIAQLFPREEAQQFFNSADPEKMRELLEVIEGADGTINEAFAEGDEDIARLFTQTKVSFENIAIEIGETLVPAFVSLNEHLNTAMDWFRDLNPETKAMVGHALALGPALVGAGAAMKIVSLAISPLIALITALTWPVILVGALLVAAGILIYKYWEPLKAFFEGFITGFTENLGPLQTALEPLQPLFDGVSGALDKVGEAIEPVIQWFKDLLIPIKDTDKETENARLAGEAFGETVAGSLTTAVTTLVGWFETVSGWFTTISDSWTTFKDSLSTGGFLITTLYESATAAISDVDWNTIGVSVGEKLREAIIGTAETIKAAFKLLFGGGGDGEAGLIAGLGDMALNLATNVGTALANVDWLLIGTTLVDYWVAAAELAWTAFLAVFTFATGVFDGLFGTDLTGALDTGIQAVTDWFAEQSLFSDGLALLGTWISSFEGWTITGAFTELFSSITDWFKDISLLDQGKALLETLKEGIIAKKDEIVAAVKDALGPVGRLLPGSDAKEGPLSQLTEAGRAIMETMAMGVAQAGSLADVLANSNAFQLPIGPAPVAAGAGNNTNITLTIEKIEIVSPEGDVERIGDEIGNQLRDSLRRVVEGLDSRFVA